MRVLYHQRTPLSAAEESFYGARYAAVGRAPASIRLRSVNLPVTPQTTGIIGRDQFKVIKRGAILINVARPELVDREALFEALDSGALAGYGTDVWYDRPAKPDDKVFGYPNVVVMPHIAIASRKQALLDTEEMFLKMSAALCARQTGA